MTCHCRSGTQELSGLPSQKGFSTSGMAYLRVFHL